MPQNQDVILEQRNSSTTDRRNTTTNYARRIFDRRNREFHYHRRIHLSDTNSFGNVYYARFFELFGEAREEFLLFILGESFTEFFSQDVSIVTVEANCKYHASLYLYDRVVVKLQVPEVKRMKFKLRFEIVYADLDQPTRNHPAIVAVGEQWVGFTTRKGKPIPMPAMFSDNLRKRHLSLIT
jgi:YbgC/YbaW family acyl-CoA thioester hydrolase